MRWAFKIARIGETDLLVHITFPLFLAWIAYIYGQIGGAPAAIEGVIFVSLIFVCVLLHEFGHAFAAARYGIRTPDITLLPIGGIARLERMPDRPWEEIVVAVAGPAVNLGIAAVLWGFVTLTGGFPDPMLAQHGGLDLPIKLIGVNIWLVLFNLIPAFPMDGGRVLRALIALRTDHAKATRIAATCGQCIAVAFGFLGLIGNPMLILIALFVYFGAHHEVTLAELKNFSNGLRVSAAMITQFERLPQTANLQEAVDVLLRTSQHEFPVMDPDGHVCGMLTRNDMIAGLRRSGPETPVVEVMRVGVPRVHYTMLFDRAFSLMQESHCPALPVLDSGGQLIGLFTPENIGKLMMVQDALKRARHPAVPSPSQPLPIDGRA